MRTMIAVLMIIAMAVIGIAAADNYEGDAKGPDDPRADVIGTNQTLPVLNLSGQKSMDIGNQALGKTGLQVVELSGIDPAIFGQFGKKDSIGDGGSYGAWKPGI